MFKKTSLAIAVLGSFLLAGVVPSMAERCEDRVRKAEENVKKEVDRHGEHSHQAEQARHKLENERAKCHVDEHHDHPDHDHPDHP
jgi:hypothetical protein